ncbi:MAG: 50S ribosomal protein L17 [uncultured bacterium]|nr:MAG: 50S ribosomal protein L17 [uncultured bacterium]OGT56470.1 MAG: 50S ribosomal protein L17 [Gammaproteobacteria bacterium RIFCSPHIGHO2_12_FULL_42_10]
MRHGNIGRGLSRNSTHRKAMFKNMMVSVLRYEQIKTTLLKAKELRRFLEPMITLAKEDTLHRRRLAQSRLGDHEIVKKLFSDLGPFYKDRPGGYLRILKSDFRKGDAAPMAIVMLVERQTES